MGVRGMNAVTTSDDPWISLPDAPAAAHAAGVPVSYPQAWRSAAAGDYLVLRKGRSYSVNRTDFLRWAAERRAAKGAAR